MSENPLGEKAPYVGGIGIWTDGAGTAHPARVTAVHPDGRVDIEPANEYAMREVWDKETGAVLAQDVVLKSEVGI